MRTVSFDSIVRSVGRGPGRRLALGVLVAAMAAGCVPLQSGDDQCPDINVNINSLKDDPFAGSMPIAVDVVMNDYLSATGTFDGSTPPPGCAVGIMENNAVSHVKGYGTADIANNVAFTHVTPSVLGSVSKTWTALAVLRLVEMGLVDLDNDTVADFLPLAPAAWQDKTPRQLLSHTSGLAYMPTFNIPNELLLSQFWFPQIPPIPHLGIHPSLTYPAYTLTPVGGFDTGASARYSNVGYMLLGAIINRVAYLNNGQIGEDYDAYESFVWRYVGAYDGTYGDAGQMFSQCLDEYWRQSDIAHLAKGYTYDDNSNTYVQTLFGNSALLQSGPAGWEGPAGGWAVTIGDLTRLMVAIQNNEIISQNTKETEMMQVEGSDTNGNWGLGVNLITKLGRPVYMHDGKYPGYRARYTVWPGEDFGVAIMCNESDVGMKTITDEIAKVFIGSGPGSGIGGSAAPGAAGISAPVSRLEVDEDDPGLAARTSDDPTLPDLGREDQRGTIRYVSGLQRRQAAQARVRQRLGDLASRRQCGILVRSLADTSAADDVAGLVDCADDARSKGDYVSCINTSTRDLQRRGIISGPERHGLMLCAETVDVREFLTRAEHRGGPDHEDRPGQADTPHP